MDDDEILGGGAGTSVGGGNSTRTMFYYVKNICIKITHQGEQMIDQTPMLGNNNISMNNRTQAHNNSGLDASSYMTSN